MYISKDAKKTKKWILLRDMENNVIAICIFSVIADKDVHRYIHRCVYENIIIQMSKYNNLK